jgi:hypothetical protein
MKNLKLNDANNFANRIASQVKAITKQIFPDAKVWNTGDSRMFEIEIEDSIINRMKIKRLGFILDCGSSKSIYFKAF